MYKYGHGGNAVYESGRHDIIDLSASINPLGMPAGVKDAIVSEINNCNRYPDCHSQELRERIAGFEGVSADQVFCGNGVSDIIFRLPRAIRALKAAVTAPTFSDYERASISFGAGVVWHPLYESNGFSIDDSFIDTLRREKPDLVFICNPNNPTGGFVYLGLIEQALEYCKRIGARVVVDECFLDFVKYSEKLSSKALLKQYSNLIILKAFTKTFALPGIRLGYAICADTKLIDSLYFHGADWTVSNLAQAAGIAALEGAREYIEKTVEYVSAERSAIENELTRLGFKVYPACANFVFLHNPFEFDLYEELDATGIRIRACGNFRGLDDSFCRIAVSTKEKNELFLSAVAEIRGRR